jgi:hypothetical protein
MKYRIMSKSENKYGKYISTIITKRTCLLALYGDYWTEYYSKQWISVNYTINKIWLSLNRFFTKPTRSLERFVKNTCTEFRQYPRNGLVANTRSRTKGCGLLTSYWTPKNLQIHLNPQLTGGLVIEEYFFAVLALVWLFFSIWNYGGVFANLYTFDVFSTVHHIIDLFRLPTLKLVNEISLL